MRIANTNQGASELAAAIRSEHTCSHRTSESRNALSYKSNELNSCSGCASQAHVYKDNSYQPKTLCNICQAKRHFQKDYRKKLNRKKTASPRTRAVRTNSTVSEPRTSAFK